MKIQKTIIELRKMFGDEIKIKQGTEKTFSIKGQHLSGNYSFDEFVDKVEAAKDDLLPTVFIYETDVFNKRK